MIKAIETVYNGYRFRSRLEARWAVFFDTLGIKYEYEKEGYDLDGVRYLPDFWLPEQEMWIEIKGDFPSTEEWEKAARLTEQSKKPTAVIIGAIDINKPAMYVNRLKHISDDKALISWTDQWFECDSCNTVYILPRTESGIYHGCNGSEPGSRFITHTPRLIAAYTVARQARFEHGETPSLISPMTPYKILQMASNLGLHLSVVEGNNVRVVGPKKNFTDALRDYIRQYKLEIIELLNKGKVGEDDCNI